MKYLSLEENVREEIMSGREGERTLIIIIIIRTLSQVPAVHSLNT